MSVAQKSTSVYQEALVSYNSENYTIALQKFQKAKDKFQAENDSFNTVNCLTYMSQIYNLQSNYESSVLNCDKALGYFENQEVSNDSLYSEVSSTKALGLKFLGKFKKAYEVSDALINYLKANKENKTYLPNAYQIKSRVEIDLGNYDDAIASAKEALVLNDTANDERKAALLNIIGVGFYFKDELDSTLHYYNKSYKIKQSINADNYQMAITTYNIGIVEEDLGNYDEAIVFYNKAAEYDLLDRGEDVGFLSDIYVALTNTYFKKNDLEKAEEFAEKALQIAIKKYGEDSPQTSFVYIAYSNIFELKEDYGKNIEYVQKALKIRRKTYGDNHRWTAESLLSISESQIKIGRFQEAEKNYMEAISIAKSIDNELVQAYAEMGLGNIYTETNQLDLAAIYLDSAESRFVEAYGNYHETHLSVLVYKAENYFKKGEFEKALQIIETIKTNTSNADLFYRLDALALQLDIALKNYKEDNDDTLLKALVENTDEAIDLIRKIRKDYPSSKSKIYVNNSMAGFTSKAIRAAYILYKNTKNESYLESAFKLSEINRSSTLVEGIQDVRFKKMANVPEQLLKKENGLNFELASLKKEMYYEENAEEPDEDYIDELLSAQLKCRKSLDSVLTIMDEEYPKYYQLKYSDKTISINELQSSIIDNDETLIEYYLENSDVYAFVITKSLADFVKLSKAENVNRIIEELSSRLKRRQDITEESKVLYDLLIKDLNINTKRLIIIPDKALNQLPFEMLISNNNTFLVEDYIISYSGSSSLLKVQEDDFLDLKFTSSWSGFAPSYADNQKLVANALEVKAIADVMKGNAFLGYEASLNHFKDETQSTSILHLATHAEIDPSNPLYSRLIFYNNETLTASDIYTMPINTDLTVLSACETGFGKLEKSEGVMSLSRAFQYAGVKSTVMSLWQIPDKESATLMTLFYGYLKKGLSKDEALQKAKIDFLKLTDDDTLRHPYYWSGFIISGDMSAIETSSRLLLLILILGFVLALIFLRKKLFKRFQ